MDIKLPDLRIVDLSRLVLHEESDPTRVEGIQARLKKDKVLGNPPVVARVPGRRRLIVLDGANRVTAVALLGLEAMLVQVVDYLDPAIRLTRWHHLLLDFDTGHLLDRLRRIPGARLAPVQRNTEPHLAAGRDVCIVRLKKDGGFGMRPLGDSGPVRILRDITGIYKSRTRIYRIADEQIDLLADRTHANVTAVLLFPGFHKKDIVRFALHDREKLPPGITKHYIPNRALKVNLPMGILDGDMDLRARNRKLDEWIARKSREKRIRAYPEPTIIFDE